VVRWPRDARDVRDGEHDEGETEHAARAGDGGGAGSDALLLERFGGGGTRALGLGSDGRCVALGVARGMCSRNTRQTLGDPADYLLIRRHLRSFSL
jgi:hypothetical protein